MSRINLKSIHPLKLETTLCIISIVILLFTMIEFTKHNSFYEGRVCVALEGICAPDNTRVKRPQISGTIILRSVARAKRAFSSSVANFSDSSRRTSRSRSIGEEKNLRPRGDGRVRERRFRLEDCFITAFRANCTFQATEILRLLRIQ